MVAGLCGGETRRDCQTALGIEFEDHCGIIPPEAGVSIQGRYFLMDALSAGARLPGQRCNLCLQVRSRRRRGRGPHNQGWFARILCVEFDDVLTRLVDLDKEIFPLKLQILRLIKLHYRLVDKRTETDRLTIFGEDPELVHSLLQWKCC